MDELKLIEGLLQLQGLFKNTDENASEHNKSKTDIGEILSLFSKVQLVPKEEPLPDANKIAIDHMKQAINFLDDKHQKLLLLAIKYTEAQIILQNSSENKTKALLFALFPDIDQNKIIIMEALITKIQNSEPKKNVQGGDDTSQEI